MSMRKLKRKIITSSEDIQNFDIVVLLDDEDDIIYQIPADFFLFEITSEPLGDRDKHHDLPSDEEHTMEELYHFSLSSPKKAIPLLEQYYEKYSNLGALSNFLSVAYERTGQSEKAEVLVKECYDNHKDYFFGIVNYGRFLVNKKRLDEFEEVFDDQFVLTKVFPYRKIFHESEVFNYYGMLTDYLNAIGNHHKARIYAEFLAVLDEDHREAKRVNNQLYWLKTKLDADEIEPPSKWAFAKMIGVILAIIIGFVYIIIQLIRWIF